VIDGTPVWRMVVMLALAGFDVFPQHETVIITLLVATLLSNLLCLGYRYEVGVVDPTVVCRMIEVLALS
jgi:hypothetical protein